MLSDFADKKINSVSQHPHTTLCIFSHFTLLNNFAFTPSTDDYLFVSILTVKLFHENYIFHTLVQSMY